VLSAQARGGGLEGGLVDDRRACDGDPLLFRSSNLTGRRPGPSEIIFGRIDLQATDVGLPSEHASDCARDQYLPVGVRMPSLLRARVIWRSDRPPVV